MPVEPPSEETLGRFAQAVAELDTHIQSLIKDTVTS